MGGSTSDSLHETVRSSASSREGGRHSSGGASAQHGPMTYDAGVGEPGGSQLPLAEGMMPPGLSMSQPIGSRGGR